MRPDGFCGPWRESSISAGREFEYFPAEHDSRTTGSPFSVEAQAVDENSLGIHWAILPDWAGVEAVFCRARPVRTPPLDQGAEEGDRYYQLRRGANRNWRSVKRASRRCDG